MRKKGRSESWYDEVCYAVMEGMFKVLIIYFDTEQLNRKKLSMFRWLQGILCDVGHNLRTLCSHCGRYWCHPLLIEVRPDGGGVGGGWSPGRSLTAATHGDTATHLAT